MDYQLMTADIWNQILMKIFSVKVFDLSNYKIWNNSWNNYNFVEEYKNTHDISYNEWYNWIIMDQLHHAITSDQFNNLVTRGIKLNHNTECLLMKNNP